MIFTIHCHLLLHQESPGLTFITPNLFTRLPSSTAAAFNRAGQTRIGVPFPPQTPTYREHWLPQLQASPDGPGKRLPGVLTEARTRWVIAPSSFHMLGVALEIAELAVRELN